MPIAITDRTIRMSGAGLVGATQSGFSSRLSAADARTLLGLSTADSPTFAGLTLSGHLLFNTTNTYDIGNGTYDPRTVRAATSVLTPLVNNASAALTLGNSTYGVTVPGAMGVGGANTGGKQLEVNGTGDIYLRGTMPTVQFRVNSSNQAYTAYFSDKFRIGTFDGTWRESFIIEKSAPDNSLVIASTGATTFSGDISMSKTSAQGYIRAYATDGVKNAALYHDGTDGNVTTSSGSLNLSPTTGVVWVNGTFLGVFKSGSNAGVTTYDGTGTKTMSMSCDGAGYGLLNSSSNIYGIILNGYAGRHVGVGSSDLTQGKFVVRSNDTAVVSQVIITESAQTADAFRVVNSAFSTLAKIDASGNFTAVGGTFSGDISMQKATQGYIRAYSPNGTKQSYFYTDNTGLSKFTSANGQMWFEANGSDYAMLSDGTSNGYFRVFSTSNRAIYVTHNNTNGEIGTSYGNLNLVPTGGTVAVTGALTTSQPIAISGAPVSAVIGDFINTSTNDVFLRTRGPSKSYSFGTEAGNWFIYDNTLSAYVVKATTTGITSIGGVLWFAGTTNGFPSIRRSGTTAMFRLGDDSADAPITCAGITASGAVLQTAEITNTPSGTTQTITLTSGNYQTLTLASSTGDVTVTLTVPATSGGGDILILQHATTSRDITWAASSGSIVWLGTEPTWNGDATSSVRNVRWRFNGTNTYLTSSGSS